MSLDPLGFMIAYCVWHKVFKFQINKGQVDNTTEIDQPTKGLSCCLNVLL